jgi:hypothetical protein
MAAMAVISSGSATVCALSRKGKKKQRRVQKIDRVSIFFMDLSFLVFLKTGLALLGPWIEMTFLDRLNPYFEISSHLSLNCCK